MGQRTPLYDLHLALGAKMVDFGGWDMPLHYGSQVEEHHEVRRDCGVFDVSHMTVIDVTGTQAKAWLQHLLANDVDRLHRPGRALYSTMLNERGGIVDDMIVYRLDDGYRLVVNASTRDQDLAWMNAQLGDYDVQLHERAELAMLAIQGPQARHKIAELVTQSRATLIQHLKPFEGYADGDWFIARTGYTGEDGLEICPAGQSGTGVLQRSGWRRYFPDWPRRPRHPAGGSRDEPLRSGHSSRCFAAGLEHGLEHRLGTGLAPVHRPRCAGSGKSRRRCSTNWSVWCWKSAVFCALIKWFVSPMLAKGRSPVVVSLLR